MMQSTLALGLREDHMSGELLKRAIERRGFKKKHIAERKGITPSTLARQLNGKHSLTLRDLREYTEILQCEFEELVVDLAPVKIIGEIFDLSAVRLYDQTEKKQEMFPPFSLPSTIVGVHQSSLLREKTLYLFDEKHMHLQSIDPTCYKQLCLYKVTNNQLTLNQKTILEGGVQWHTPYALGYIYPEPEGKYTVGSAFVAGNSRTNQDLTFAAPIIAQYYNPLGLGWQNATK